MLEFDESKHQYKFDGKRIPCVSDICRFLAREVYGDEPNQTAMDIAADRGTRVHAATEEYDKEGTACVDSDIAGYVQAYSKFKKEHDISWQYSEQMGYFEYGDMKVGGRFDRAGLVDGINCLVDIKTTANITNKHKLLYGSQLYLYGEIHDRLEDASAIKKYLILQLDSNGDYKLIEAPDNSAITAMTLLSLEYNLKKVKGKRKNG